MPKTPTLSTIWKILPSKRGRRIFGEGWGCVTLLFFLKREWWPSVGTSISHVWIKSGRLGFSRLLSQLLTVSRIDEKDACKACFSLSLTLESGIVLSWHSLNQNNICMFGTSVLQFGCFPGHPRQKEIGDLNEIQGTISTMALQGLALATGPETVGRRATLHAEPSIALEHFDLSECQLFQLWNVGSYIRDSGSCDSVMRWRKSRWFVNCDVFHQLKVLLLQSLWKTSGIFRWLKHLHAWKQEKN